MKRIFLRYVPGLLMVSLGMLAGGAVQSARLRHDDASLAAPELQVFRLLLGLLLGPLLALGAHRLCSAWLQRRVRGPGREWLELRDALSFLPLALFTCTLWGGPLDLSGGLLVLGLILAAKAVVHRGVWRKNPRAAAPPPGQSRARP